jgi:hypothetical protein
VPDAGRCSLRTCWPTLLAIILVVLAMLPFLIYGPRAALPGLWRDGQGPPRLSGSARQHAARLPSGKPAARP